MPAMDAKITYETGKSSKKEIQIVRQKYNVVQHGNFSERQQRPLSIQQKEPNELHVDFYILTYSGPVLKRNGEFVPEKIEDARESVRNVQKLLCEIGELHRQPVCKILWGEECFSGMLTSLDYRYTMYANNGTPIRVNCQAVFKEWIDVDSALKNDNTPQSPDRSKYRMVYENTQLCQMAYQEYDDPGSWRLIAEANGINDPLDLTPGMLLALPPDH